MCRLNSWISGGRKEISISISISPQFGNGMRGEVFDSWINEGLGGTDKPHHAGSLSHKTLTGEVSRLSATAENEATDCIGRGQDLPWCGNDLCIPRSSNLGLCLRDLRWCKDDVKSLVISKDHICSFFARDSSRI